jgi:hypothetical protein
MMRAKTEQKVKRWKDQRWLIDWRFRLSAWNGISRA